MLKKVKEQIKRKLEAVQQKKKLILQEVRFFIEGLDTKEDVIRIVKIASIVGILVLVIMLTGKTIQYVTKEKQTINEKTQVVKETEVINTNPTMQEQYKKLLNRVEKLTEKRKENEPIDGENGKDGVNGIDGKQGLNGESGRNGEDGRNGKDGRNGEQGLKGKDGENGEDGLNGKDGLNGNDGKSAYTQAVEAGYTGTEENFSRTMATVEIRTQEVESGLQNTSEAVNEISIHLNNTNDVLNTHINDMQQTIGTMHENFQNGCNIISAAITAQGVDTPPNSTPNTMAENIGKLAESKYKQGYVDGIASVGVAGVEYEYHYHDGNEQDGGACFTEAEYHTHDERCYGVCPNKLLDYIDDYYDGNHDHKYIYRCGTCGFEYSSYGSEGDKYSRTHISATPLCGKSENQLIKYKCTCGRTDGEIISAKITY